MFAAHSAIQLYKAKKSDLVAQLLTNSTTLMLKHKYSANDIARIDDKYRIEEDLVRNEMDGLDDKTSNEYLDLMAELQELKDDREREKTRVEEAAKEFEDTINRQNTTMESQIQAIDADLEGLKEMRKQDIESEFNYFQN